MLKKSEISSWTEEVLTNKVIELKGELFNLKMQKSTSGIDKPHQLRELKKDIARLRTELGGRRQNSNS